MSTAARYSGDFEVEPITAVDRPIVVPVPDQYVCTGQRSPVEFCTEWGDEVTKVDEIVRGTNEDLYQSTPTTELCFGR